MRKPSAPLAEDPEITVAATVIRVARERDARVVLVVGAHADEELARAEPLLEMRRREVVQE